MFVGLGIGTPSANHGILCESMFVCPWKILDSSSFGLGNAKSVFLAFLVVGFPTKAGGPNVEGFFDLTAGTSEKVSGSHSPNKADLKMLFKDVGCLSWI